MLCPKSFKTVKQPSGSRCCGAAVAAMAVGRGLRYVLNRVPDIRHRDGQRWLRTRDLLGFLGNHGIHSGELGVAEDSENGMVLNRAAYLELCTSLRGRPCILSVPSGSFPGYWHYIFWDGQDVRDPSPSVGEITRLEDYRVFEAMPLVYVDERRG